MVSQTALSASIAPAHPASPSPLRPSNIGTTMKLLGSKGAPATGNILKHFTIRKTKLSTLLCFIQVASASLFYILKFYKLTVCVCLCILDFGFSSAVFNIHTSPLFQEWKETKRTEYTGKKKINSGSL